MFPLHPFTVHFPIALLLANGLLTWLYLRRKNPALETSAYHCLVLGWLGAAVAVVTGLFDAVRQLVGPTAVAGNEVIGWVNAHALVSIAVLLVYGQALLQRRRRPDLLADPQARPAYLRLLALGAILVVISGWLGGWLVYRLRLGVQF